MASLIDDELKDLKARLKTFVSTAEIIGAHRANVQIRITRTRHKQCICQFQFPADYPRSPILIELKSKIFSVKVLDAMTKVAEAEAKKLLGKPQILPLMKFLNKFIEENPLLLCSEEISNIKKNVVKDNDEFKIKQKAGVVNYKIVQNRYYLDVKLTVPDLYPDECVLIDFKGSNFPNLLETHFVAQAKEIARQCVQPPLKKNPRAPPFVPSPSLLPVIRYLAKDSVHKFPLDVCPCCRKSALPADPAQCAAVGNEDHYVEWVYCGHVYHHKCLDDYMKAPPFTGGKKCPTCQKRIYHEKWNISPELAEDRWAHQEARKREIDEVSEFLDLM